MGRIITIERKAQIAQAREDKPEALGPVLAELIIDGNIPVEGVAAILEVSEPTIYRWMYGQSEPRDQVKIRTVKKLIAIIRKAKRSKDIPLAGNTRERTIAFLKTVETHRRPA